MSRHLATLVFTLFVIWLWRKDKSYRGSLSPALWIPLIWLLVLASHPPSWWFSFFLGINTGGSNIEGNVVNRIFYSSLIFVSIGILFQRSVSLQKILKGNSGLFFFLGFLGITFLWAELPIPTIKRWIKEIGAIPVLLVILTDKDPIAAIKSVFTRCAFIIIPFSVLTAKYIPEIGRSHASFSGAAEIIGIAPQKNSLGESVAVLGLFLFWQLLDQHKFEIRNWIKLPCFTWFITLAMGIWLLYVCDSKSSMVSLAVGCLIVSIPYISALSNHRKAVLYWIFLLPPAAYFADKAFSIYEPILSLLGRDATLTNRTNIWNAISERPVDPLLGSGFLNYWDTGYILLNGRAVNPLTAHNGYLDIYLDGGIIGLIFLGIMVLHILPSHCKAMLSNHPLASVGLAIFVMTLLVNVSESVFARRGPLWTAFLLTSLYVTGSWRSGKSRNREYASSAGSKPITFEAFR